MTRLTSDDIKGVPHDEVDLDSKLMSAAGITVKDLACMSAGLPKDTDLSQFRVACVPITSGLGVIGGFSDSVNAIVGRLGMDSFVTSGTDVNGFAEGVRNGADIIMMADDDMFVAYNVHANRMVDNSYGTALGYSVALKEAAGGLEGKQVLVVGAGFVGSRAACILKHMGADVGIVDVIREKAVKAAESCGVKVFDDTEQAISAHRLVLNAAPYKIPGKVIAEGSIISSPGVPHYFDELGRKKAKAIIHDPLEIGTAVMAVGAAAFTIRG